MKNSLDTKLQHSAFDQGLAKALERPHPVVCRTQCREFFGNRNQVDCVVDKEKTGFDIILNYSIFDFSKPVCWGSACLSKNNKHSSRQLLVLGMHHNWRTDT